MRGFKIAAEHFRKEKIYKCFNNFLADMKMGFIFALPINKKG